MEFKYDGIRRALLKWGSHLQFPPLVDILWLISFRYHKYILWLSLKIIPLSSSIIIWANKRFYLSLQHELGHALIYSQLDPGMTWLCQQRIGYSAISA